MARLLWLPLRRDGGRRVFAGHPGAPVVSADRGDACARLAAAHETAAEFPALPAGSVAGTSAAQRDGDDQRRECGLPVARDGAAQDSLCVARTVAGATLR